MAASHSTEIADPPDTFKSPVWEHFGFPVEYRNGIRVVDKAHTICRNCFTKLSYTTGNTSNMQAHLRRHHPNIDAERAALSVLSELSAIFRKTLSALKEI